MADENEDVRIKDLTELKYDGFLPLDDENGTGKFPIRNIIDSISEPFNSKKEGGYRKDTLVTYHGILYRFKVDHPEGVWDAAHVESVSLGSFGLGGVKVVSNTEYVYAVVDSDGNLLFGVKSDGTFSWAKGLSDDLRRKLDVIFDLLKKKADKEDGKSLVDSVFANGVSFVSNGDYLFALVDSENSVLFGVKKNGAFYWANGMSSGLSYNLSRIFATLSLLDSNKVDKEDGKSLINSIFANDVSIVSNDEYLVAFIDSENSVLFGVKKDGGFEYGSGIPMPIKQSLYKISHRLEVVEKGIARENLNFSNGYYNVTDTPKQYQVAPASPSSSADYVCAKTSVKKGDLIVLTGHGAISARLWVFVDENRRIIQCSNANWSLYGGSLFAPVDGYLLVSARKNYYHSASIFRTIRGLDGFVEAYKPHFDFPLSRIYQVEFANASQYIKLLNYMGNNQNVHPKVLYINEGFGGHRYWMGYTPYPGGSSQYENPCVAFSDDGFLWFEINGNPIKDEFSKSGDVVESYGSDTHLVYREDLHRLELWWRKVIDVNPKHELLYRSLSTDGRVWSEPELVFTSSSIADVLSPAVIYQNGQYIMWVVEGTGGAKIKKYIGSVELGVWNWSLDQTINLTFSRDSVDYYPWHLDVSLVNGEYAMCVMCKETDNGPNWDLFVTTSSDAVNWSVPKVLAIGNQDGWDQQMYRSCLLYSPYDGNYRLYYSARTSSNFVYGLGLAMGKNLNKLFGTQT